MTESDRRWLEVTATASQAKIVLAVAYCVLAEAAHGAEWLRVVLVLLLLTSSILLSAATKDAAKSRALGRLMAFMGASLSLRLVLDSPRLDLWLAFQPEVFIGAAGFQLASSFKTARVSSALARTAVVWGALDAFSRLLLAGGTWLGVPGAGRMFELLPHWDWVPTYSLSLIAMFPLLRALRHSEGLENRQLRGFIYGLAIGVAPFVLILPAAALIPEFNDWLGRREVQPYFLAATYPFLMVFPITASYAVLYQGVLDYQSALRRAAQYALARYTLLSFIALPLAAGVLLLYVNREEPLGRLLTGGRFLALVSIAVIASAAFPLRYRLLAALDRRYFREAYDARVVLRQLTEAVRKTRDIAELSAMLVEQVDKALHLESVVLMAVTPEQPGILKPAAARGVRDPDPVPTSAQFVSLVAGSPDPLSIDSSKPGSLIERLPEKEKEWLQRAGVSLLVPLLGSGEMLTGFLALGRRRSEMPFSADDRELLASVGAAAGISLEARLLRATPTPGGPGSAPSRDETPPARECLGCLGVFEAGVLSCPSCGAATQPALLPRNLLDKYRLESRLGSGGFGVVYAATELRLGRRVALKTLPRISGERVERFKREALAAAAIQHPNLAMIHTAESWNETPILVFELLDGGTLAQRLLQSTLSVAEALDLGVAMAGVLEEAHKRGILHRDIKPSNIGYDARQVPKLLDFGVARMRDPATPSSAKDLETITLERLQKGEAGVPQTQDAPLTETGAIVGTPAYMPLEAYQNREPGPAFDLWALAVTLYEALTGNNPYRAPTPAETIERLLRTNPTPLHEARPECPRDLSDMLGRALSKNPSERPASAAQFSEALQRVNLPL